MSINLKSLRQESIRLEYKRSPVLSSLKVTFMRLFFSYPLHVCKPLTTTLPTLCNYEKKTQFAGIDAVRSECTQGRIASFYKDVASLLFIRLRYEEQMLFSHVCRCG